MVSRYSSWTAAIVLLAATACSRQAEVRQYELVGQILAVRPERSEVVIKHENIKDFMPAMTMPFKVRDTALLGGKRPGDLVSATLVVENHDGQLDPYLSAINVSGNVPLTEAPAAPPPDMLEKGERVADAKLVDQNGAPRPISSFRGHPVALTFIYTRCPLPEFCPLMDRHFGTLQKEIQSSRELADVRLVTITFDPEFDTPAVLKSHASRRRADPDIWTFLTGEPAEVSAFAKQFGIYIEKNPENAGDITHNLRTAVIDRDGRIVAVHTGNSWTPADLLADLKAAAAPTN